MTAATRRPEPGLPRFYIERFYLGFFALVALSMLLVASWLRGWVPVRQTVRIRDVTWLPRAGR